MLGGETYTEAQCLALLDTPPRGDASLILAHQLIAAELNAATGATVPGDVADAIDDANAWLVTNADGDGRLAFGRPASSAAGAEATALAAVLDAYNQGTLGTPHCE